MLMVRTQRVINRSVTSIGSLIPLALVSAKRGTRVRWRVKIATQRPVEDDLVTSSSSVAYYFGYSSLQQIVEQWHGRSRA